MYANVLCCETSQENNQKRCASLWIWVFTPQEPHPPKRPSTLGQILRYWGAGKSSSTATSLSIAWWTWHGFNSHWFWELIDLEACEHNSHKILFQTQFSDHRMVFVRREQDVQLLSKSRADYRCRQADTHLIWHYTMYHFCSSLQTNTYECN